MQQCRLPAIMLICVMMLKVFTSTHAGSKDARRLMREQSQTSFSVGSRGTFTDELAAHGRDGKIPEPEDAKSTEQATGVSESEDEAMHNGEHSPEDTPADRLCPDSQQPKYMCPRDKSKPLQDQDWNCMTGFAEGNDYGSDKLPDGEEEHERVCCCRHANATDFHSCWLCECVQPIEEGACGSRSCPIAHSIKECAR
mmetsp:Transcript_21044/g.38358  ORF Transcript_21044/g.38358 Transcript_21044/m.38358 type:complete len:197 (+) Transcript_21044:82-672(+)